MPKSIFSDDTKQRLPLAKDGGIAVRPKPLGEEIYFKLRELVPDLPTTKAELHSIVGDIDCVQLCVLHHSPDALILALTQSQRAKQSAVDNLFNIEIAMFPAQEHAEAICYASATLTDADWHWKNRFLSAWLSRLIVDGHVFQQAISTR